MSLQSLHPEAIVFFILGIGIHQLSVNNVIVNALSFACAGVIMRFKRELSLYQICGGP
jgi:hypothetical protein